MSHLLIPKPTCFRKCLTTFFTGICLVTYCAGIWLLSWMSLLLILKPTCFRKCLMTYLTGICLQKLASPQKGFSPKMCTPRNFYRNICVGSRCISNDSGKLKLKEDYHHLYLHKYVFKYVGIILGKKLSSVPKVCTIMILIMYYQVLTHVSQMRGDVTWGGQKVLSDFLPHFYQ